MNNPLTIIERRFKFIKEDIDKIEKALKYFGVDIENLLDEDDCSISTYLSNIEIACDLNDQESDKWKLHTEEN